MSRRTRRQLIAEIRHCDRDLALQTALLRLDTRARAARLRRQPPGLRLGGGFLAGLSAGALSSRLPLRVRPLLGACRRLLAVANPLLTHLLR